MTEAEWLECADPIRILDFARDKVSDRKKRMFAVACCRRISHFVEDAGWQMVLNLTERYADDNAVSSSLDFALQQLRPAATKVFNEAAGVEEEYAPIFVVSGVYSAVYEAALRNPLTETPVTVDGSFLATEGGFAGGTARLTAGTVETLAGADAQAANAPDPDAVAIAARRAEEKRQLDLLRCVLGNPFKPVILNREGLPAAVVPLAQSIYQEKAFDRLPILADALEDAGCDNRDILDHCRGPGPHVRGCWVVDLVLGRS